MLVFLLVACCISLLLHNMFMGWARQMGAGLVRFRIHSGPVGGPPLPQTLISAHCWLVHVEGFSFFFILRVSLTPLTDYLIFPLNSFSFFLSCLVSSFSFFASSRIPCSIYCLLLSSLLASILRCFSLRFALLSFGPICSTLCTRWTGRI